jgi:hypothetical protein
MSEQENANELGRLIDGRSDGTLDGLPTEEAAFARQLLAVRDKTQPDDTFAAALEARLKAAPHSTFIHQSDQMSRGETMITHRQNRSLRALATVAAVLAIAVFATLTVPPLRTLAQEVLERPTPVAPPPVEIPVSQQLEQAIGQAGFPVRLPAYVPEGYILADAGYDPVANQVSLFYTRNGIGLVIVQIPEESALPLDVGATADILTLSIGGVTGQYVEGGWKVNPEVSGETMTLTEKAWDTDFPFQQLRWQQADMVYWMMSVAGQHSDLTLEQWVQIGESLR